MMNGNGSRGTLLVVGGGVSGITAAVEASEVGCDVILIEQNPYLGGRVAQMSKYFPKLCPPSCGLELNTRHIKNSKRIRCLTMAEVRSVSGRAGSYRVHVEQRARRIKDNCTACGACAEACPVERANDFNYGMDTSHAAYVPFHNSFPARYVIDPDACRGSECGECVAACQYDAIDLQMKDEEFDFDVDSIIWATGWSPYDASRLEGLGFGQYPNVITNVMMERLASVNGPSGGAIVRPSDGGAIESVAFVQCAGSRDDNYLKHCSGACCLASLKQGRYVREQYPDAKIYIYYIDIRAPGRLEDFYATSQQDPNLFLTKGKVARITETAGGDLVVEAEDVMAGTMTARTVDLVVLATGMVPADLTGITVEGGLVTDDHGFLAAEQENEGMLAAGCARRPMEASASTRDATAAVLGALKHCGGQDRG